MTDNYIMNYKRIIFDIQRIEPEPIILNFLETIEEKHFSNLYIHLELFEKLEKCKVLSKNEVSKALIERLLQGMVFEQRKVEQYN